MSGQIAVRTADAGGSVTEAELPGRRVVTESAGGQVVGKQATPAAVAGTDPSAGLDPGSRDDRPRAGVRRQVDGGDPLWKFVTRAGGGDHGLVEFAGPGHRDDLPRVEGCAAAATGGDKLVDPRDAAAIQAAEMRATSPLDGSRVVREFMRRGTASGRPERRRHGRRGHGQHLGPYELTLVAENAR
ncbi:hypothetical protein ACP70R_024478 [Stipagrostis hirtigluma subsp. patula]